MDSNNNDKHNKAMIIISQYLKPTQSDLANPKSIYNVYNRTPSVAEAYLKNRGYSYINGEWVKKG